MSIGAFGENFPYSNFHDLNMDWIIKIAKDFLDQYSQIQTTVDNGLTALDTKAENLENLLQEWYDTHSSDIANELTSALADINATLQSAIFNFNQSADQKATETIASIPDDYTALANAVLELQQALASLADEETVGSWINFSSYQGMPLFGSNGFFTGSGTTRDIVIPEDAKGKNLSTYMWLNGISDYIDGHITEVQLDANNVQIYPPTGYHYVGHPMTILANCAKIRYYASPNAYNSWNGKTITHIQFSKDGDGQYNYGHEYIVPDVVENTNALNDIAIKQIAGSWIDFTDYQGIPLIGGLNGFFPANVETRVFSIPEEAIGLTLSTYMWLTGVSGYIEGNITEVQLDENDNQIFPTSGYHYVGHPMTILPNCKKIRYFRSPHAVEEWSDKYITHIQFSKDGLEEYDFHYEYKIKTGNTWKGKKWVSYGDSITQRGTYQEFVVNKLELIHVNAGLGGSCVADNGDAGIASFTNQDRISALPADADIVTIMGGTNDFNSTNNGQGTPLGDLPTTSTFDTSTFKGALSQTVKLIQNQCPNAVIVILTNIGGRGTSGQPGTVPVRNSLGLTTASYAEAAIEVAKYFGLPYIDTHSAGINPFNRTLYIEDSVHQNVAGAELISRPIIAYFEGNMPRN